jgi:hypothetical protein
MKVPQTWKVLKMRHGALATPLGFWAINASGFEKLQSKSSTQNHG